MFFASKNGRGGVATEASDGEPRVVTEALEKSNQNIQTTLARKGRLYWADTRPQPRALNLL